MSTHFKWYPSSEEVVIPFNARYEFPSQANKAVKMTPRIPPKNGSVFSPGQVMRLEFPAQGYVNPANTTLEFDVALTGWGTSGNEVTRFQNNIQSIFTRVRLLYGATPLEDIINYNVVVRALTEWTGTNQTGVMDQTSIREGIGGVTVGFTDVSGASPPKSAGLVNVRQAYIQGIDNTNCTATTAIPFVIGSGTNRVPNTGTNFAGATTTGQYTVTRRYQVSLALGIFNQDKLIPTKFMASQLAIELTLENANACIISWGSGSSGATPTYSVGNVNLIPEILEFDASYDAMFLKGLQSGGVPIKFSSWHTFIFSTAGSANVNLLIQERSRSVKSIFAVQRRSPAVIATDSHAFLYDSSTSNNTLQNYQFRIGGRYFPAAPVQTSNVIGGRVSNGGAEAYVELEKALNTVGDYRLSTNNNVVSWASPVYNNPITLSGIPGGGTTLNEVDYACSIIAYTDGGSPDPIQCASPGNGNAASAFYGNSGSGTFTMSTSLETSNGMEISGLNAEEQSDIALIANWSASQQSSFVFEVYTYYDAMLILRENNVLELIQ